MSFMGKVMKIKTLVKSSFGFVALLALPLLLQQKTVGANDEVVAAPPILGIMVQASSKDETLLEMLDRFDDTDLLVAYPEEQGGGFTLIAADKVQDHFGDILDDQGQVVYRDDQPVTVGQVKEAIKNQAKS